MQTTATTPDAPPAGASRSQRTAQALLDCAERLFAESGVASVSVREIVKQSGQHNASAARYHFGTKDALIVAVVERRMQVINASRNRRLDALEAAGQANHLRAVMSAIVEPLAEFVRTTDWGARYVQIIAELGQRPAGSPETHWDRAYLSAMDRADAMIRRCLPDIPYTDLRRRLLMIRGYIPYSLSGWVRLNGPVTPAGAQRFQRDVQMFIDFMSAGVGAPG